ncbi:hypothetical protein [Hydrogenophaga defluvii]|uniref:RiboL-PSP-HEPN domain-containing protein n=1 Tax=Hydrogenophaga defluvii TaxID=249410 RepID=A0ABW2SB48_9BURK
MEQVPLRRLLENAYEQFSQSLHSANARFVLWASFRDADDLQQHYFSTKGKLHLVDKRRNELSLTDDELVLKNVVQRSSIEAAEYVEWARLQNGQPILQEMLVSYCSAFEACLKNVALVCKLASSKRGGLDDQVFVPGPQFSRVVRELKDAWNDARPDDEKSRAEVFFESFIQSCSHPDSNINILHSTSPEWSVCRSAFVLRNAIVHQLGRPSQQVELGLSTFHPGWEMQLTPKDVDFVKNALLRILGRDMYQIL